MTYGTNLDKGTATFELSAEEHQRLLKGEGIQKRIYNTHGAATITVSLAWDANRFPPEIYGDDYQPPEENKPLPLSFRPSENQ